MAEKTPVFTGNEGEIILNSEVKAIKDAHKGRRSDIEKEGKDNYVEAEFFGLNTFKKLIKKFENTCVGFRVYYGNREEDHSGSGIKVTKDGSGKRTARVVIVPVDQYGNDLRSPIGLKDDDDGSGMANGPLCPNKCAPPTDD